MTKILTFLDANVLIAGTSGNVYAAQQLGRLLTDPNRAFVTNDFLELEVLPKKIRHKQQASVQLCQSYFAGCVIRVATDNRLIEAAFAEACRVGLSAIDAIHLVTAQVASADEFITLEKPTKPMYQSKLVMVRHLSQIYTA